MKQQLCFEQGRSLMLSIERSEKSKDTLNKHVKKWTNCTAPPTASSNSVDSFIDEYLQKM